MPDQTKDIAKDFSTVFSSELTHVLKRRAARQKLTIETIPSETDSEKSESKPDSVYQKAHKAGLFGIALSGGGIRSATFNLGVLQALAQLGVLQRADYLSTVSGGGYIGSWLQSWIKRRGNAQTVYETLGRKNHKEPVYHEPHEVRFLRDYSNYLTPRKGIFGADTWTVASMYLRNLFLNLLILVCALVMVLLLPHLISKLHDYQTLENGGVSLIIGLSAILCSIIMTISNLEGLSEVQANPKTQKKLKFTTPLFVIVSIIIPVFVGAYFLNRYLLAVAKGWSWPAWLDFFLKELPLPPAWISVFAGSGVYFLLWCLGIFFGNYCRGYIKAARVQAAQKLKLWTSLSSGIATFKSNSHERLQDALKNLRREKIKPILSFSLIAGAVGGLFFWLVLQWHIPPPKYLIADNGAPPIAGVLLIIGIFIAVATLHIGLVGRGFSEEAREWWGRLGAYVGVITLWLVALFVITLNDSDIINGLFDVGGSLLKNKSENSDHLFGWPKVVSIVLWALITIGGVVAGKSSNTNNRTDSPWISVLTKISPFVFVLGLLLALSWVAQRVMEIQIPFTDSETVSNSFISLSVAIAVLGFIAVYLSRRIGVNEFSMHSLYRNRLVRCYLGAVNNDRKPHPFTGFDPTDDAYTLDSLTNSQSPYPIINATLNLVHGNKLGWQDRKAASFTFTPHFSGYEYQSVDDSNGDAKKKLSLKGYRPTRWYGPRLTLGNAFAVSGAAASPNMGYHSSPALSFLMTVFNVRLGCWIGNPRRDIKKMHHRMGPSIGLFYLFSELLGNTNDVRKYLYISDGGHFENLGLYELVRRRCRYIIVSDAGADPSHTFGDLGNAIEKCRTDFGIDISIDVNPIRFQAPEGKSQWHCAVGKIHYNRVDENAPEGIIVYIKPSLTGDEPTDIQRYASKNKGFPHQSTADQWFDESQFESYRMLGEHIVQSVFQSAGDHNATLERDVLFDRLRKHWYPPTIVSTQLFTKHTATFAKILEMVRNDSRLEFLDQQMYPEWRLFQQRGKSSSKDVHTTPLWLPKSPDQLRAGFYICNEMIQLMEDAHLDLHLEEDFDHPDNRGWINLFKHWSWSGMFRVTWAMCAGTYGARFQTFCKDYLDLDTGTIHIHQPCRLPPNVDDGAELLGAEGVLNFVEKDIIRKIIPQNSLTENLYVIPFSLVVQNPVDKNEVLEMPYGFCLARFPRSGDQRDGTLLYFRIQDHLRKMGLAHRTLHELTDTTKDLFISKIHLLDGGVSGLDGQCAGLDRIRFESLFHSILER